MKKYLFPLFFGFTIVFFEDIIKEDIGILAYIIKGALFIVGLLIFEGNLKEGTKISTDKIKSDDSTKIQMTNTQKGLMVVSIIAGGIIGYFLMSNL